MTRLIAQVVEGFGEVEALPQILQRRLAVAGQTGGQTGAPIWITYPPINARGRGNIVASGGIEENVRIAKRIPGVYSILIVVDAEDDPVCPLGPDLARRAQAEAGPMPVRVCLASRQFENWLAACDVNGQPWTPTPPSFEGPGAVDSLKARMPRGRYKKTAHQPQLTGAMNDGIVAQRCPSFGRLLRCIDELVTLG